jgi:hypothetical protein
MPLSERTLYLVAGAKVAFAWRRRCFAATYSGGSVFTLRSRSLIPSALGHWRLWVIVGDN